MGSPFLLFRLQPKNKTILKEKPAWKNWGKEASSLPSLHEMKNFTSTTQWEPFLLQHINANNNWEQTDLSKLRLTCNSWKIFNKVYKIQLCEFQ